MAPSWKKAHADVPVAGPHGVDVAAHDLGGLHDGHHAAPASPAPSRGTWTIACGTPAASR